MEPPAPIPRFQKSATAMSKRNKYALAQKLGLFYEMCSETFNEVGARLIEREAESERKIERGERERSGERERGENTPAKCWR